MKIKLAEKIEHGSKSFQQYNDWTLLDSSKNGVIIIKKFHHGKKKSKKCTKKKQINLNATK